MESFLILLQGNLKAAMDTYEKILESPNGSSEFRASVYCQLGKLFGGLNMEILWSG